MQKINTCIVYNQDALEAVKYYVSIFTGAKILNITHCGENEPSGEPGSVRTISFLLLGQEFLAINGGSHFFFNDAVSLMVSCENQREIDEYWNKLSAEGEKLQCGWVIDKFGLRWQIVPRILEKLMIDSDKSKSDRVVQALILMDKIDINKLEEAAEGISHKIHHDKEVNQSHPS